MLSNTRATVAPGAARSGPMASANVREEGKVEPIMTTQPTPQIPTGDPLRGSRISPASHVPKALSTATKSKTAPAASQSVPMIVVRSAIHWRNSRQALPGTGRSIASTGAAPQDACLGRARLVA